MIPIITIDVNVSGLKQATPDELGAGRNRPINPAPMKPYVFRCGTHEVTVRVEPVKPAPGDSR